MGSANISSGAASIPTLAFDNSGTLHVAYIDGGTNINVKEFNGSNWVSVGSANFASGTSLSMAFEGNTPYVAFSEVSGGKMSVMEFDGSSWVYFGTSAFSSSGTDYASLAFDGTQPYVGFQDFGTSGNGASVMTYTGTMWDTVGLTGFSAGSAQYISLALDGSTPYVAFKDDGNGGKATVMKYNGSSWVNEGPAGFSPGIAQYTSLAFHNGDPYVAYTDDNNSDKTRVDYYNGTSWIQLGGSLGVGFTNFSTLTIPGNTAYVVYVDGLSSNGVIAEEYTLAASMCSINASGLSNVLCNDNGTPSDPTDDYITFDLNPTGTDIGTTYTVTGATLTPSGGNYGSVTSFQTNPGTAGGGNLLLTIVDGSDPFCTFAFTVSDPGTCSPNCEITGSGINNIQCNNNGTPSDPTDDYITFDLDPTGNNLGTNYTVSGTNLTPSGGNYGAPTSFQTDPGTAGGGNISLTITDGNDSGCTLTFTLNDPGSCSTTCNISGAGLSNIQCNNNGTPSNPTDDYVTFELNPTGTNLGAGYTVSVPSINLTPSSGTYGSATLFTTDPGVAGSGSFVVTIEDNDDSSCTFSVTVNDPGSCSPNCEITSSGLANVMCNDNSTPTDPTDDYITFDLNPDGFNLGSNYTVSGTNLTPSGGNYGFTTSFQTDPGTAGAGNLSLTITDGANSGCTLTFTVIDPGYCSTPCNINITSICCSSASCSNIVDGIIAIDATSFGCTGYLEYALNGGPFQSSNFFLVSPGTFNIEVRCSSNISCTASYSGNPVIIGTNDSSPPSIASCPSNSAIGTVNNSCISNVSWTHPTINDNCPNPTLSVAYSMGFPAPLSVPSGGTVNAGSSVSEIFQKGQTVVSYTATDEGGNSVSNCSFTVTVSDDDNPSFSNCPSNITESVAAGVCNKSISWTHPTVNDNCPGAVLSVTYTDGDPVPSGRPTNGAVTSGGNAGETFEKGETIVTYSITDCGNNQASNSCSFKVTLTDDEAPSFSNCPSIVNMSTSSGVCNKAISWTHPTVNDNCPGAVLSVTYTDGDPIPSNRPSDGDVTSGGSANETFEKGETIVTYSIVDCGDNQASNTCSFTVTLTDDEDPVISNCPSNISQGTDNGVCEADVSWTHPILSDNCPGATMTVAYTNGNPAPGYTPGDGSATSAGAASETFDLGQTVVTYSAIDCGNNSVSTCSFTVDITDDEKPGITCPSNLSVNNDTGTCNAVVTLPKSTNDDNCGVDKVQFRYQEVDENNNAIGPWTSWEDEANCTLTLDVGKWKVRWRARDEAGNQKGCNFFVTVVDNTPPVAQCQDITVQLVNGTAAVDPNAVDNGSSDNCGISNLSVDQPNVDCDDLGANVVTLTVLDVNGNQTTCTSNVTVLGPTVTIDDVTHAEGTGAGFTFYFFKVKREGETCAMQVDYSTSDGSATLGDNDYVSASGTQYWPPGGSDLRYTIVRAVKDSKVELDEVFNVDLSNASAGIVITDNQGEGTIENDDFSTLIGSTGNEVCDGLDNDGDGQIDEHLENSIFQGSLALTSQNEVDHFPDCIQSIDGYLYIEGNDITDLSPLSKLKSIRKDLIIMHTNLENLSGIDHLTKINGAVFIYRNDKLRSLAGLETLAEVGTDFTIYKNPQLQNCCPVNALIMGGVGGKVLFHENETGCENRVEVVNSCKYITTNPCLGCPAFDFAELEVYPNPAVDEINVVITGEFSDDLLQITDILGRTIYEQEIHQGKYTYQISTQNFKRGIYWVSVFQNGLKKSKKVVLL